MAVVTASVGAFGLGTLTAFSGTLDFSGPDAFLGVSVTDGEAGSIDVGGVVVEIYSANAGSNSNNGQTWSYYSDLFGNGPSGADDSVVDDSGSGTPVVVIRSQNGDEFSFTGIEVVDYLGAHAQVKFEGFRNGASVGSVTLATDGGDFISDFTQANGLTPSIFQYVDEVRVTDPNPGFPVYLGLDNLGFAAPVVPNAAPVIGSLHGDSAAFTEGGAATLLDAGGNGTVTDADSVDFAGGHLMVAIVANRIASEDVLSIVDQGAGAGQIGVSGSAVTYGGITIGTRTGGTGTSNLVVSLNASATPAAAQALLRTLTYSNTNTAAPSTSARIVRVTLNDGDGGTSSNADVTVSVVGVNDAPTVANAIPNQNATEDAAFNFQFAANTFNDVDPGASLTYSAQLAGGGALPAWLSFDAATRTFSGTPTNGVVGTVSIDVIANDGNGGTVTDTFDIAVTNTNDAPTVANAIPNQNATEDAAFSYQFAANTFNDIDTGASLTYSAQLAGGGALPAWLSFDAATRTFNGTPANSVVGTASIDVIANDGNGGTVTDTFDIVVANTNDAPTVVNPIPNQNATEDAAFNFQFAANAFADVDAGATLLYAAQLTGGGSLPAWLSFNAVTRVFSGTPADGDVGTISLDVIADDGNGGTVADTFTIANASVNDAPVVTTSGGSVAFTEGADTTSTPVAIDSGMLVADADTTTLASATVAITANLSAAQDVLSFVNGAPGAYGNITGSYNSGTGVLTLTSAGATASVSQWQAALRAVTYTNTSDRPSEANRAIAVVANDGLANSFAATRTLAVVSANDAPVNSVPGLQTVTQGGSLVFGTGSGNAISIADVDAGNGAVRLTLTATHGVLSLGGTAGLAFSVGSGSGDATMTFTGSLASINTALQGLTFTPQSAFTGAVSLWIAADDQGLDGFGGARTDTDLVPITVAAPSPTVTSVSSPSPDGGYKIGDALVVAVTFDSAVTVDTTSGVPTLLLETGSTDRAAIYVAGSGSNVLSFGYTVQAGDLSADLEYASSGALSLNGATIRGAGSLDAVLTLPTPGGVSGLAAHKALVIDGVTPVITAVAVPAAGTYTAGQALDFVLTWSEPVSVDTSGGAPVLVVTLDQGGPIAAAYVSTAAGTAMLFRGVVAAGQVDTTGVTVTALTAGPGALLDVVGNAASRTLAGVAATGQVLVDAEAPAVGIGAPSLTSTTRGPVSFPVTYSGASTVTLTVADVVLVSTGTATGTLAVTGTGTSARLVTVSDITGTGTLAVRLAAGTASDAAGNTSAASATSAVVQVQTREVTGIAPTSGLASGGVVVTLTGVGFTHLVAPTASFGGAPARLLEVRSDTEMRLVTPTLPPGAAVDVVVSAAAGTVATLSAAYTPLAAATDPATDTDGDLLPDAWELRFGLDALMAADALADPDGDGHSSLAEFARGTHPRGTWRRALAEGVSGEAFATSLAIFNPGVARSAVVAQYLPDSGTAVTRVHEVEMHETARVSASGTGLPAGAFATWLESDQPLAAEGMTTWGAADLGGGAEQAREAAATWYLAEGSTAGVFDLFYLLANPGALPVEADVTFLRPAPAPALTRRYTIAPHARLTLWVDMLDAELASSDVSGVVRTVGGASIVVERAMYRHEGTAAWGAAGHRASGATSPSTSWHLAEGHVGGLFDTYLLIANPQERAAMVEVTAHGDAGLIGTSSHVVAPGSRLTLAAGDLGLPPGPVAFTVRSTNGEAVVVERAMWWGTAPGTPWVEAHASGGAALGAREWALADLRDGGVSAQSQYVLLQNLEAEPVSADLIVYVPGLAAPVTRTVVVPGASRLSLDLGVEVPEARQRSVSAVVRATGLVVVEASRYWDVAGIRWGGGVNTMGVPLR